MKTKIYLSTTTGRLLHEDGEEIIEIAGTFTQPSAKKFEPEIYNTEKGGIVCLEK